MVTVELQFEYPTWNLNLELTLKGTVIYREYSTDEGDPYYPVPNERNRALYRKYQDLALKEPNVMFVGRLASYKYFNMDEVNLCVSVYYSYIL